MEIADNPKRELDICSCQEISVTDQGFQISAEAFQANRPSFW
jgi:hypothetical protein